MRINKYLAMHTKMSRRNADEAIANGLVRIDGKIAELGNDVKPTSVILLNGVEIKRNVDKKRVVLIDKPVGYVCSKDGQGSPTVYDLLPEADKDLNIAGRLDKDSSGLVILTNDGELLNELTHPSNDKKKVYEVTLDNPLTESDILKVKSGVSIGDDRPSLFQSIRRIGPRKYEVVLTEGRNRQIRRSFEAIRKNVVALHRTKIGEYTLE